MIISTFLCLALNIFFEASHESTLGKEAVGHVTFNRTVEADKSTCGVVFEKNQFSWTKRFKYKSIGGDEISISPNMLPSPTNKEWVKSKEVASTLLYFDNLDITYGATFFHNKTVHPNWSKKMVRTTVIGQHLFYRKKVSNSS